MSKALSPSQLNSAWLRGLIDVAFLNPLRDPMPQCAYDPDSDLAELWHYGAQWAMSQEGVEIDFRGDKTGDASMVTKCLLDLRQRMFRAELLIRPMTQMNQAKELQT